MQMFFESLLPKSLARAADVTEIALRARKLVNDSRHKRFLDLVIKRKNDESVLEVLQTILYSQAYKGRFYNYWL